MASLLDLLNNLINPPQGSNWGLILPAIAETAGIMMLNRPYPSRLGTPLGAALQQIGGDVFRDALTNRNQYRQNANLGALLSRAQAPGATGVGGSLPQLIAEAGKQGLPIGEVVRGYQAMYPKSSNTSQLELVNAGGKYEYIDKNTGKVVSTLPPGTTPASLVKTSKPPTPKYQVVFNPSTNHWEVKEEKPGPLGGIPEGVKAMELAKTPKPPAPKYRVVFNPATNEWEVKEETPGPLGGIPEEIKAAELRKSGGTTSPLAKLMETPVGMLTKNTVVTPDGRPWPDPKMSAGEALAAGGVMISDRGKEALEQLDSAVAGLDDILETGRKVLPGAPGSLSAYTNPIELRMRRAAGDPDVAMFDAAKISLINHLRAVAKVSRVNRAELDQVNAAMSNANSYPALVAAVQQAEKALERARPNLVKAGILRPLGSGGSGESGSAPPPGAPVAVGPGGKRVYWNGHEWVPY